MKITQGRTCLVQRYDGRHTPDVRTDAQSPDELQCCRRIKSSRRAPRTNVRHCGSSVKQKGGLTYPKN